MRFLDDSMAVFSVREPKGLDLSIWLVLVLLGRSNLQNKWQCFDRCLFVNFHPKGSVICVEVVRNRCAMNRFRRNDEYHFGGAQSDL